MQRLYFSFLFIYVFLIVVISSNVIIVINRLYYGINNILEILISNLFKSNNYFLLYLFI